MAGLSVRQLKELLERSGEQYEAGVHSRWVFHGARNAEVLESIITIRETQWLPGMDKTLAY